jgi:hypothetical protein
VSACVNTSWGLMYSDPKKYFWLMTPVCCPERLPQAGSRRAAKRGPPFGLPLEAHRTASQLLHGQPARACDPFLAGEPPAAITVGQSNVITL